MPAVELEPEIYALVTFGARLLKISESEFIARLLHQVGESGRPTRDPWEPVDVFAEYAGRRIDGQYISATNRLTVTSEPLAGTTYGSPSAAARAVVGALNPDRVATETNGLRFWRIASTGERLAALK